MAIKGKLSFGLRARKALLEALKPLVKKLEEVQLPFAKGSPQEKLIAAHKKASTLVEDMEKTPQALTEEKLKELTEILLPADPQMPSDFDVYFSGEVAPPAPVANIASPIKISDFVKNFLDEKAGLIAGSEAVVEKIEGALESGFLTEAYTQAANEMIAQKDWLYVFSQDLGEQLEHYAGLPAEESADISARFMDEQENASNELLAETNKELDKRKQEQLYSELASHTLGHHVIAADKKAEIDADELLNGGRVLSLNPQPDGKLGMLRKFGGIASLDESTYGFTIQKTATGGYLVKRQNYSGRGSGLSTDRRNPSRGEQARALKILLEVLAKKEIKEGRDPRMTPLILDVPPSLAQVAIKLAFEAGFSPHNIYSEAEQDTKYKDDPQKREKMYGSAATNLHELAMSKSNQELYKNTQEELIKKHTYDAYSREPKLSKDKPFALREQSVQAVSPTEKYAQGKVLKLDDQGELVNPARFMNAPKEEQDRLLQGAAPVQIRAVLFFKGLVADPVRGNVPPLSFGRRAELFKKLPAEAQAEILATNLSQRGTFVDPALAAQLVSKLDAQEAFAVFKILTSTQKTFLKESYGPDELNQLSDQFIRALSPTVQEGLKKEAASHNWFELSGFRQEAHTFAHDRFEVTQPVTAEVIRKANSNDPVDWSPVLDRAATSPQLDSKLEEKFKQAWKDYDTETKMHLLNQAMYPDEILKKFDDRNDLDKLTELLAHPEMKPEAKALLLSSLFADREFLNQANTEPDKWRTFLEKMVSVENQGQPEVSSPQSVATLFTQMPHLQAKSAFLRELQEKAPAVQGVRGESAVLMALRRSNVARYIQDAPTLQAVAQVFRQNNNDYHGMAELFVRVDAPVWRAKFVEGLLATGRSEAEKKNLLHEFEEAVKVEDGEAWCDRAIAANYARLDPDSQAEFQEKMFRRWDVAERTHNDPDKKTVVEVFAALVSQDKESKLLKPVLEKLNNPDDRAQLFAKINLPFESKKAVFENMMQGKPPLSVGHVATMMTAPHLSGLERRALLETIPVSGATPTRQEVAMSLLAEVKNKTDAAYLVKYLMRILPENERVLRANNLQLKNYTRYCTELFDPSTRPPVSVDHASSVLLTMLLKEKDEATRAGLLKSVPEKRQEEIFTQLVNKALTYTGDRSVEGNRLREAIASEVKGVCSPELNRAIFVERSDEISKGVDAKNLNLLAGVVKEVLDSQPQAQREPYFRMLPLSLQAGVDAVVSAAAAEAAASRLVPPPAPTAVAAAAAPAAALTAAASIPAHFAIPAAFAPPPVPPTGVVPATVAAPASVIPVNTAAVAPIPVPPAPAAVAPAVPPALAPVAPAVAPATASTYAALRAAAPTAVQSEAERAAAMAEWFAAVSAAPGGAAAPAVDPVTRVRRFGDPAAAVPPPEPAAAPPTRPRSP